MSLTAKSVARLGASFNGRARIADPIARELAKETKEKAKADALAAARERAERFIDYSDNENARIALLHKVYWPRARTIRNAMSECNVIIKRHNDKNDDYSLTDTEYDSLIIRECRLSQLLALAYSSAARIGSFPVSRHDMRTDKGTIFLGSARKRHFTFSGGRDMASSELEAADIVQGAFIRAIENGDTVHGVPTYGSMFRHVQSERAERTRLLGHEWAARRRAALGDIDKGDPWPSATDKHAMRLIGAIAPNGKRHADIHEHRLSIADMHRDVELGNTDSHVTESARAAVLENVNFFGLSNEFHVIVAEEIRDGNSIADMADALGITAALFTKRAAESAHKSMRAMSSGIDHSVSSLAMTRESEREYEIDMAQARHAATLRRRELNARIADYANKRR